MTESNKQGRYVDIIIFVAVYIFIGMIFAALANTSSGDVMPGVWRIFALLLSALVFAINISYEHFRLYHPPRFAAFRVSVAVAIATFILAAIVNLNALMDKTGIYHSIGFGLIFWPLITGVISFFIALIAAVILKQVRPNEPID